MRIALLADPHANLEALTACLEHARGEGVEGEAYLGDLVGYGADPGPVVDQVMASVHRGAVAVLGNHDQAVVGRRTGTMAADATGVIEWTRAHLGEAQRAYLDTLPLVVERPGQLFVHANAWAPGEWEYINGSHDAGRSMRAASARLTFCGHVHQPGLYHLGRDGRAGRFQPVPGTAIRLGGQRQWLAIPGSVGQPRDGNPAACYATFDDQTATITFFRVPYDCETTARKIRQAGLPEVFARRLELGG